MAENMEEEKMPGFKEDTCIVYMKEEDVKEETTEIQGSQGSYGTQGS